MQQIQDQPLMLAGIGIALGALAGTMISSSGKVKEKAKETTEKARQAAEQMKSKEEQGRSESLDEGWREIAAQREAEEGSRVTGVETIEFVEERERPKPSSEPRKPGGPGL